MPKIKELRLGSIKTNTYTPIMEEFLNALMPKVEGKTETLEFTPQTLQTVPKSRSVSMVLLTLDKSAMIEPHQRQYIQNTVAQFKKSGKETNLCELDQYNFLVGEFSEKEMNFAVVFDSVKLQVIGQNNEMAAEKEPAKKKEKAQKQTVKSYSAENQPESFEAEA